MNYTIRTELCGKLTKLIFDSGFFRHTIGTSPSHKHAYSEIHIVSEGSITHVVGNVKYTLEKGDALIIPAEKHHFCDCASKDAERCSFMIDIDLEKERFTHISPFAAKELIGEIDLVTQSGNYAKIIGYLSLIFSQIFSEHRIEAERNPDDAFIIGNYIEKNYAASPSLEALAAELNLSIKQTARLVQKYTGNAFSENIAIRRMAEVKSLIQAGEMTKKQISEYVGYSSYSGFYKAYKKFYK